MKKNILIVNYNMIVGGSTTSLINFLNLIDKNKYEIDVLLYKNEGELLEYLPDSVSLLPQAYIYNERKNFVKILKSFIKGYLLKAKILNLITKKKSLSNQVMSECQAKEFSRKLEKKYDIAIGYLEGWADRYVADMVDSTYKYGWLHSTFINIAPIPKYEIKWMKKMDKVICVSKACRDDMVKLLPDIREKSIVVENMVDRKFILQRSYDIDTKDKIFLELMKYQGLKILSVCRLSIETKGIDRIIKCVEYLIDKKYEFKWVIIGDGDEKNKIQKIIKAKNLESYLLLAGSRKNPYPFMSISDFICMPSRWEGKPMTILEAKALGVPCLVTNYLSAFEQINNGKTGWIVENDDDSIIPMIEKLINQPNLIKEVKRNLIKNPFSNSNYIKKIEEMLFEQNLNV